MTYTIVALGGDGIGPEVLDEAVKVLRAVEEATPGLSLDLRAYPASAALHSRTGEALPAETFEAARSAHAILLGAMGLPDVRMPDGTEVQGRGIIRLRKGLDLYAGVRPIKRYPGVLVFIDRGPVDLVIVRENSEGLFASFDGGAEITDHVVGDTLLMSRRGTERITRAAFTLARGRSGRPLDGRARVTCVDKANIFRSLAFFRRVFTEVAGTEFPGVEHDYALIDALSLAVLQDPGRYDVLVTENMFGDILSDLATALCGGLGMAPSGDVGDAHAMFQPSHGSAPTLAGLGVANPVATILSARMMLDWLGTRHADPAALEGVALIDRAVGEALDRGVLTADLGGTATTAQMGDAVAEAVARIAGGGAVIRGMG
ncbi:isocitrate/isopropylmalate dehydrogenase family protein [Methylobacterium sp. J-030]|uniref:isocitrate/isopropylmalate dehydrogenase family protein n=1 Tax=Methylobacterium sp. J-030 TaxID=2836627 RepID=UPI001FBB86AE|nr:isocitrate/isopropylmalate dehydrogenase family protein [Methylobacterium sp. J-030]MCJ2072431.1 isocitrate/isopropylmalate dehydrogenase family protein [Methylobacterium sp. J-030]